MEDAADPYADRYGASYSIYGDADVDALLAVARPWAPFRVWRKGESAGGGRVAKTAGVTIDISEDGRSVEPAVLRFLMEERVFLAAAARIVSPDTRSVLTCRMWVNAAVPSQVVLSATTIAQLAAARVELEVVGYPAPVIPVPEDDT
jgi:hypothetical protein